MILLFPVFCICSKYLWVNSFLCHVYWPFFSYAYESNYFIPIHTKQTLNNVRIWIWGKQKSFYHLFPTSTTSKVWKPRWHRCINTEEYFCWHRGTAPIKIFELDEKDGDIKVNLHLFFVLRLETNFCCFQDIQAGRSSCSLRRCQVVS